MPITEIRKCKVRGGRGERLSHVTIKQLQKGSSVSLYRIKLKKQQIVIKNKTVFKGDCVV